MGPEVINGANNVKDLGGPFGRGGGGFGPFSGEGELGQGGCGQAVTILGGGAGPGVGGMHAGETLTAPWQIW